MRLYYKLSSHPLWPKLLLTRTPPKVILEHPRGETVIKAPSIFRANRSSQNCPVCETFDSAKQLRTMPLFIFSVHTSESAEENLARVPYTCSHLPPPLWERKDTSSVSLRRHSARSDTRRRNHLHMSTPGGGLRCGFHSTFSCSRLRSPPSVRAVLSALIAPQCTCVTSLLWNPNDNKCESKDVHRRRSGDDLEMIWRTRHRWDNNEPLVCQLLSEQTCASSSNMHAAKNWTIQKLN